MKNSIKKLYLNLPLRKPVLTILISTFFTLFLSMGILWIHIDDDFVKMFPDEIPSKLTWDNIQEDFGATDYLVVAFGYNNQSILNDNKAYQKLVDVVDEFVKLKKLVSQVISITDDLFFMDSANNLSDYKIDYRKRFMHNSNYASIYVVPKVGINNAELVNEVQRITNENLIGYDVHFAGQPYLTGKIPEIISKDVRFLMLIGMLIMLVLLIVNLKSLLGVLFIFITTIMSLISMIGFMGWLYFITGYDIYNFTILSTSMPIILLTIANSDGVHIMTRFKIEFKKTGNSKLAISKSLKKLRIPIFLTSLTTAIAFLSMIFSPIPHMVGYGIVVAFGIICAWILSTTFLPAMIYLNNWNLNSRLFNKESIIEKSIGIISKKIIRNPKIVLISSTLIVLIALSGLWFVKVEVNVINFFKESTSIRKSTDFIDKELSGSMNFTILSEGDFKDLNNIIFIDSLKKHINSLNNIPEIKQSISYSDIVKESYKAFNTFMDTLIEDKYPDNNEHLSEIMLFAEDSGARKRIESIVNKDKNKTLISYQMKNISTERASEIAGFIDSEINNFNKETNLTFKTTGLLIFLKDFVSMVVQSSLISIIVSIFIISIIIYIFFRKIYWAILSIVPLVTAIVLNFGLMGLFGIELSHLTALLTSVLIGVGADFSIHYISDYRNKFKNNISLKDINLETSRDVGYPIMLDVVSNLGFLALLFSLIIPLNYIGGLMIFAMISTSFGTLTILSSIIEIIKNKIRY